jgi:uncharacterized RDD family membrane protein YckC
MYCLKCGVRNPDDAKFCTGCGSQLGTGVIVSQDPPIYYAGFWRRFVAFLLDEIILVVGCVILLIPLAILLMIFLMIFFVFLAALGADMHTVTTAMKSGIDDQGSGSQVLGFISGIIYNWLYFTLFESSSLQATPGKMALGIIVTDLSGNRISFVRANGRYWGKILSGLTLWIGYIMAGFTRKKQALHDILADTLVVKK